MFREGIEAAARMTGRFRVYWGRTKKVEPTQKVRDVERELLLLVVGSDVGNSGGRFAQAGMACEQAP